MYISPKFENRGIPLLEEEIRSELIESLSVNKEQSMAVERFIQELEKEIGYLLEDEPTEISKTDVKTYEMTYDRFFNYLGRQITIEAKVYSFPDEYTYDALNQFYTGRNAFNSKNDVFLLTLSTIGDEVPKAQIRKIAYHELFHGFQLPKSTQNRTPNQIKYNLATSGIRKAMDEDSFNIYYAIYSSYKIELDAFLNEVYGELKNVDSNNPKDYWEILNKSDIKFVIDNFNKFIYKKNNESFISYLKEKLIIFSLKSYRASFPELEKILKTGMSVQNFYKRVETAKKYAVRKLGHILTYVADEKGIDLLQMSQLLNNDMM